MKIRDNNDALKNMAQKYSIELLLLFGSQVSGKVHEESDYDIGYISTLQLTPEDEGKLMLGLASVLKIPIEKIELVSLRGASPLFLKEVFDNVQVLYAKDNLIFDEYKIYAIRYFDESKALLENMRNVVEKRAKLYEKELAIKQ